MATSYTQFVGAVAALSVTGVTKAHTEPPQIVASAHLPCSFPRFPAGLEPPVTADGQGGYKRMRCELVILIEPWGLSDNPTKFALVLTLMDNLTTALRAATLVDAGGKHSWDMQATSVTLGENVYSAIVTGIQANAV